MLRRRRTPLAPLALATVLAVTLTACGDEEGPADPVAGGKTLNGFDAVEITGEPGSAPTVDFKGSMKAGEAKVETLTEGTGPALAEGDTALVDYYVGNGTTQTAIVNTYGGKDAADPLYTTIGTPSQPQAAADLLPAYVESKLEKGVTAGTRIAIAVSVAKAFPGLESAVAELGLGNEDAMIVVADVVEQVKAVEVTKDIPGVLKTKGEVSGIGFNNAPKEPSGDLEVATIKEGTGPVIKSGDSITVDYLGSVYGKDKVFDESYTKEPATFQIGVGGVIKGWDLALVGRKVGTRVILTIPAPLAYGAVGSPPDIPANATLSFIIDLKKTAATPAAPTTP